MPETPGGSDLAARAEDILRRRADALALSTDEDEAVEGMSLLLFRIADEWYAVETGDVREIFQDYVVTPIPCVPEFVLGVVNIRGEILSVIDPAAHDGHRLGWSRRAGCCTGSRDRQRRGRHGPPGRRDRRHRRGGRRCRRAADQQHRPSARRSSSRGRSS